MEEELKKSIIDLFRTWRVVEFADIVAVKLEGTDLYYIEKYRYETMVNFGFNIPLNKVVRVDQFRQLMSKCDRPIVLSSEYMQLTMKPEFYIAQEQCGHQIDKRYQAC